MPGTNLLFLYQGGMAKAAEINPSYMFSTVFVFSVFTTKLMLYSQVQALLLLSGQSKSLGQSRQVGNDHCTGIIVSFASLITGSESKVLGDHCTRIITFFQSSIIGSVYR